MAQKRVRGICNHCTGQLGSTKTFYQIHLTVEYTALHWQRKLQHAVLFCGRGSLMSYNVV